MTGKEIKKGMKSLVFFVFFLLITMTQGCFFVGAFYGKPLGTGKSGNGFEFQPGVQIGGQVFEKRGKGLRAGTGYQKLRNTVKSSTAEGYIIPVYLEYLGKLYHSSGENRSQSGLHFSLGINYNRIKIDDVAAPNDFLSMPVGLTFHSCCTIGDISFVTRYHYLTSWGSKGENYLHQLGHNNWLETGLIFQF